MCRLDFRKAFDYSDNAEGIVVPVVLRCAKKQVRLAASVDTGASFCLFSTEVAEALGLNIAAGIPAKFRTANSVFDAYGHEVELEVLGIVTMSMVYFFADALIDKNVLGRIGWLDRVRLGLIHHDSSLYLASYDEE